MVHRMRLGDAQDVLGNQTKDELLAILKSKKSTAKEKQSARVMLRYKDYSII